MDEIEISNITLLLLNRPGESESERLYQWQNWDVYM